LGVFGQSKPHFEDTLGERPAACRATVTVHAYAMVYLHVHGPKCQCLPGSLLCMLHRCAS
jgi:hypothetical protein